MKNILLGCLIFLLGNQFVKAQTTLTQGDIAFIGHNLDGVDAFAFILLKDIDATTTISFTDCGWNDGTGFSSFAGDAVSGYTWSSGSTLTLGTVVTITVNAPGFSASIGTVSGVSPVHSSIGDQLFAYQGAFAAPTLIAGLNSNETATDANWNGAATTNSTSALPNVLTNGVNAIRLHSTGAEKDNWQYNCTVVSGDVAVVRAAINNVANWSNNNATAFSPAAPACVWSITASAPAPPLVAGDIAFIGMNADATEGYSFIALTDIAGSDVIFFSDRGIVSGGAYIGGIEGTYKFTAPPAGISCGTIVSFDEDVADVYTITGITGATMVQLTGIANFGTADQIYAYQTATDVISVVPSDATFIAGLQGEYSVTGVDPVTKWTQSALVSNTSESIVPPGLTNGVNCVSVTPAGPEKDNLRYIGTLTGTSTSLRASINDYTNWETRDSAPYDIKPSGYATPSVTCAAPCSTPTVPTVTFSPATVCNGSTATLSISGTLNDATAWHIYTGSCGGTSIGSTTTGTFNVSPTSSTTYFIRGEGGCVTPGSCGSATVTVNSLDNASYSYASASYCVNAADPTPTITGLTGGTFSSTTGLSINASTGAIDVSASTPATYTTTYTTAGTCPNSSNVSVTINALDDASYGYASASYCVNAVDPTPTITGLPGGTFSSTAGLSINTSTGAIDVSASTPASYTITYTTAGSCPNSSNVSVTINALDDASYSYASASYCVNAVDPTPTITGLAGGTFSSTAGLSINASTGAIDVSASTPATYTITYTTAGTCPNSSNVSVTINSLDDASFSYSAASYCVNAADPTPTITGLAGGTFSSTAGLSINASTGAIDVSASTPASYTITYTTAGSCPNSSNVSVTINSLDDASFSYSAASYCANVVDPTPTITGLAGGTFSSTAGLSINASTGAIDVSASTPASYTITYTTAGSCPNSSNVSVTINSLDDASFSYALATYCPNGADPTPSITGLAGGTFSSTVGLSIISSTGIIDLSATTPGSYVVTYTTIGSCPNSSNFNITVNDVTLPLITCPGNQAGTVNASCQFTLPDYTGLATASDNCSTPTITQSPVAGTIVTNGTTTISLTATDALGNTATCNFNVIVSDAIVPTAICQNITVFLNAAGNATIAASDIDGGSSDNCSAVTLSASQTTFTCANLGSNNVTLTVTDGSTNTANCIAVVTVSDTISPVLTCPGNQTETPNASCQLTLPDYTGLAIVFDNCNLAPTIVQAPAAGTVISGTTTVTFTANDGNGNSSQCTFNVILNDLTAPTISCPGNQTGTLDASCQFTLPDYTGLATVTDNCDASPTVTQVPVAGTTISGNGTVQNVILTVTDASANSSTCNFNVTVNDLMDPIISCPANQNVNFSATCDYTLQDYTGLATVSDNCSSSITISQSPAAGTAITSSTTITLTANDGNGNTAVCTFDVIPTDNIAPTVVCQGNQNEFLDANCEIILADYTSGLTTADNCTASLTIVQVPAIGASITTDTIVKFYVSDAAGNIDSCSFALTVQDTISPSIVCPTNQNVDFSASCGYTLLDYTTMATGSDNCGTTTMTQSPIAGTIISGTTSVTLTITDGSANSSSCSFDVIPSDNTAPTITCIANQVEYADANCNYSVPNYTGMATTSDNCSAVITVTQSPTAGTTISTGVTQITLTANDGNGNTSNCFFDLTVNDTIMPVMTCIGDQTSSFNATCGFALLDYASMASVTDNCGTPTIIQSPTAGTIVTASTVVTLSANDGNGNIAMCTFNVILTDTDSPILTCPSDDEIFLDANCIAVLPDFIATSFVSDNCDANPIITQSPIPGTEYTNETSIEVVITATDIDGNKDSCSFNVDVLADANSGCLDNVIISNLISPNGDGKNDFWIIHETSYIAGCDVMVYNRWGAKVFESQNYDNTWGGTLNGEPLPDGSYYYIIQCDGVLKYKGSLSILKLKK